MSSFADVEERVAALLESGDLRGAATTALRGYGPQILAFVAAGTRDATVAQEVFSTFAEDLWRGLPTFRGESSFRTWAFQVARQAMWRSHRDAYRKRAAPLEDEEIAAEVRASTALYRRTAVKDKMRELRDHLSAEERTLLTLRVDSGMSWREIATLVADEGVAVDEAALRKRFERAKAKLRDLAREAGVLGGG